MASIPAQRPGSAPTLPDALSDDGAGRRSAHLRGVLMVAGGSLCLVPDATLVRLADAGDWQIIFWRTLFVGLALAATVVVRHRRQTFAAVRAIGRPGLLVGGLWGLGLTLFVYSINHTAVANTLVILATAPFLAALFTRLLIGEPIHRRTWFAALAAAGGVALTFASALRMGGMSGNVAALVLAAAVGFNLTVIRRSAGVDMLPAVSLAGFVAAAVSVPGAWPLELSRHDFVVIAAMGFVFVPAALTLVTLGTRYLTSPEVTLFLTIETVLGPLLAWVVVNEAPPPLAVPGGVIVVGALALHSLVALRSETQVV